MIWPTPLEWFSLFMFLVSVPLYIAFLATIIKFRHKEPLNSPFFMLCLALGVGDIAALLNQWFFYKFEQFNWLGLGEFALGHAMVAYIAIIVSWELGLMQHIAVALLALNRLIALVTPNRYKRVWTTKITVMAIILEYGLPLIAVIPQCWLDFGYIVDNDTGSVGVPVWLNSEAQGIYYTGLLVFNGIMNSSTLIMYCIIFYSVHRHLLRIGGNVESNQQHHADTKLAVFGLCVFVVMFIYGIYSFLMAIQPPKDIEAYRFNVLLWQTISDVFSWCNPWLIIVCSKQVRDHMLALICCKPPPDLVIVIPSKKSKPTSKQAANVAESKL